MSKTTFTTATTSTTEDVSTVTTTASSVSTVTSGDAITADTFQKMLAVLNELVSHTHIFYDDYNTACNCNCNCDCTRGTV